MEHKPDSLEWQIEAYAWSERFTKSVDGHIMTWGKFEFRKQGFETFTLGIVLWRNGKSTFQVLMPDGTPHRMLEFRHAFAVHCLPNETMGEFAERMLTCR